MIRLFQMLAHYNEWANLRLYDCAAALTAADLHTDGGAFFGSVLATLNHVLVADRIWMHRLRGDGETYEDLATIVHDDLEPLRFARLAEDRRITRFVEAMDDAGLRQEFTFRTIVRPATVRQPRADALLHLFNHQTHHRGQVHALLTGIGGRDAAISLDLVQFQRETHASHPA